MCGGVVRCPDGTPLLFIRPTEQGDRLSASRLRSGSASSSHPPALASSQVEDTPAAQRGLRLHPIQKIFDQLLPLFEARYVRHKEPELDSDETFEGGASIMTPDLETLEALEMALNLLDVDDVDDKPFLPVKPDLAVAATRAALLKAHETFLRIASDVVRNEVWPKEDKLSSRIGSR